jgi:HK97 gp10 family phage protein
MINFKLVGVQKALNQLRDVENELTEEIDIALEAGVIKIEGDAKKRAPIYLSGIRQSIQHAKVGHLRWEVAANAYHAPYIEFGTRGKTIVPNDLQDIAKAVKARPKKGNFKGMVKAIHEWGLKKGYIEKGKGSKNHAYLIARKIMKDGIRPQPFLYPAFLSNARQIVKDIKRAMDEKSG